MPNFTTVKSVFDYYLDHLVIDQRFCKTINKFKTYFTQKNDDHLHFFSEKLFGCYSVKWMPDDDDIWWNDICGVDEDEIQHEIWKLPNIRKEFKVSSNAFNQLLFYLIHRVHHAMIDDRTKEACKADIMTIFNIKALTSNLANWFKYGLADKGLSEATYNALSRRFDLKTSNGWGDMLTKRAIGFVSTRSPHYQTYVDFTDDLAIVSMINDARTRINATVLEIGKLLHDIKDKRESILKSSVKIMGDDTEVLKDLNRTRDIYKRYLANVIGDHASFIKPELIEVIISSIPSIKADKFKSYLMYLSDHYDDIKQKQNRIWVDSLLVYTFNLMEKNNIKDRDLLVIASKIRQNFMAGRVNDPAIVKIKTYVDKMLIKADPKLRGQGIVAERVGLMIYVILRAFTKSAYS